MDIDTSFFYSEIVKNKLKQCFPTQNNDVILSELQKYLSTYDIEFNTNIYYTYLIITDDKLEDVKLFCTKNNIKLELFRVNKSKEICCKLFTIHSVKQLRKLLFNDEDNDPLENTIFIMIPSDYVMFMSIIIMLTKFKFLVYFHNIFLPDGKDHLITEIKYNKNICSSNVEQFIVDSKNFIDNIK